MDYKELSSFLEKNLDVEWTQDEEGNIYLRHTVYDKENEKLKIEPKALTDLTPDKLEKLLKGGRNVEHITRVTGYFSRVEGWNRGKRGELMDRYRVEVK